MCVSLSFSLSLYIYMYTHAHVCIYIYIYIHYTYMSTHRLSDWWNTVERVLLGTADSLKPYPFSEQ